MRNQITKLGPGFGAKNRYPFRRNNVSRQDQLLAGSTDYGFLRAEVWKQSHPEAVRTYRSDKRRDTADRNRLTLAQRRPANAKKRVAAENEIPNSEPPGIHHKKREIPQCFSVIFHGVLQISECQCLACQFPPDFTVGSPGRSCCLSF